MDLRVIDVASGVGKSRLVNLSEIADTIEYIPLETNEKSLFNPSLSLSSEGNRVYFRQQTGDGIIIFDTRGKYIFSFNREGRGPQEYEQLGNWHVDNVSGNICVKSYNKITEYDHNGNFVRIVENPDDEGLKIISLFNFKTLGDFYIFEGWRTYSAIVIDSLSNIKKLLQYPEEEKDRIRGYKYSLSYIDPYIYKFKDTVRLINGNSKYVLSIDKNLSVDTTFIINYGKYDVANASEIKLHPNSPYLWRSFNVFESDNYLFMQVHTGSLAKKTAEMLSYSGQKFLYPISCSLFNKRTGEFIFLDQQEINRLGFVDDIEGGPAIWPKHISSDNYLVSYITADDFITYAEKPGVSERFRAVAAKLKDSDNPVLVRVKLK